MTVLVDRIAAGVLLTINPQNLAMIQLDHGDIRAVFSEDQFDARGFFKRCLDLLEDVIERCCAASYAEFLRKCRDS